MSTSEARFDVFLSYAREDADVARRLHEVLERKGLKVFLDQKVLPGERWVHRVEAALKAARHFVLVVTPSYLASEYAAMELGAALSATHHDPETRIIPILLGPLRAADLPGLLREWQAIRAEPSALDDAGEAVADALHAA